MIPRILNTAWFGRGEKSDLFKRCLESWARTNPEWQIIEWNEDNVPGCPYLENAISRRQFVKCTEYARLYGVAKNGGVYLDLDVELVGPLEPLRQHEAFFCRQADGLINGAAFGAQTGHWTIRQLLGRFPADSEALLAPTDYGPVFLTNEVPLLGDVVTMLPTKTFFPYHYTEQRPAVLPPETIGVHLWQGSWARPQ